MYGLINEAMRRHVVETAGPAAWSAVASRAGSSQSFAALHYYDDDVTYALVGAANEVLDRPADELLRGFGRYWSTTVGPESYGDILGATGTDVVSVLHNLDEMHARLQSLYPDLRPPSFDVVAGDDGTLDVHYRSEREGLAPFVVGLLEGLGELYGTPVTVSRDEAASGPHYEHFRLVPAVVEPA
ncbi:MAG: heme NO-binding domain-containing protein [Candidatus Nanopelagicales bacterium]